MDGEREKGEKLMMRLRGRSISLFLLFAHSIRSLELRTVPSTGSEPHGRRARRRSLFSFLLSGGFPLESKIIACFSSFLSYKVSARVCLVCLRE